MTLNNDLPNRSLFTENVLIEHVMFLNSNCTVFLGRSGTMLLLPVSSKSLGAMSDADALLVHFADAASLLHDSSLFHSTVPLRLINLSLAAVSIEAGIF